MAGKIGIAVLALTLMSPTGKAVDTPIVLSVKPSLCIVDQHNTSCRMTILIVWQSETAGSYCLHNDVETDPISCWTGQSSGRTEEARVVETSLRYWLTDTGSETAIAEASVAVMSAEPGDRRENRRRRHAWSIL